MGSIEILPIFPISVCPILSHCFKKIQAIGYVDQIASQSQNNLLQEMICPTKKGRGKGFDIFSCLTLINLAPPLLALIDEDCTSFNIRI